MSRLPLQGKLATMTKTRIIKEVNIQTNILISLSQNHIFQKEKAGYLGMLNADVELGEATMSFEKILLITCCAFPF